jgi:hypothetical protein
VRLLALPALAFVVLSFGTREQTSARESLAAKAAETTLSAGTARFVVSSWDRWSGVIDLRNETAVSDRGWIFGEHASYLPLARPEAAILGLTGKHWTEQPGGRYLLVDDPFLAGTRNLFEVISHAERIQPLGPGIERGTPVQRYVAYVPLQAFVSALPPLEKEKPPPGKPMDDPGPSSWRDYLVDYRGAEVNGQRIELAVDAQDRIRRVRLDLDGPTTVELYDYGVRVDASAPPANEVVSSSMYEQTLSDYCHNPRRQTLPRPYPCQ